MENSGSNMFVNAERGDSLFPHYRGLEVVKRGVNELIRSFPGVELVLLNLSNVSSNRVETTASLRGITNKRKRAEVVLPSFMLDIFYNLGNGQKFNVEGFQDVFDRYQMSDIPKISVVSYPVSQLEEIGIVSPWILSSPVLYMSDRLRESFI